MILQSAQNSCRLLKYATNTCKRKCLPARRTLTSRYVRRLLYKPTARRAVQRVIRRLVQPMTLHANACAITGLQLQHSRAQPNVTQPADITYVQMFSQRWNSVLANTKTANNIAKFGDLSSKLTRITDRLQRYNAGEQPPLVTVQMGVYGCLPAVDH